MIIINNFTYSIVSKIFFTIRKDENIHIYFWICKDLGWIFNCKEVGILFGTCALFWMIILGYDHYNKKDYEEIYFLFSTFLWLFANYLWMIGNLIYGTDIFRFCSSCIMMIGLISIIFYFSFLKNKNYFLSNCGKSQYYVSNGLICKFKNIGGWRRYEYIHMFFWLLKDYCWCSQDKIMWLAGVVPTIYISIDLIIVTWKNKELFVDFIHYLSQLIWVCSNITWAFFELFNLDSDLPPNYYNKTEFTTKITGRKIASIILILSWMPIVVLYFIWLPLSIINKIKSYNININNNDNDNDNNDNDNNDNILYIKNTNIDNI
jgi:hypothetical protein